MRRRIGVSATAAAGAAVLVSGSALLAVAQPAFGLAPTTRYVAVNGDDSSACTDQANPCATIQHAVDVSAPGDVVSVGAGTFNENVSIGIDLTIVGAGGGQTTVTGSPDPQSPAATFDIEPGPQSNGNPTVTLRALDISNNQLAVGVQGFFAELDIEDSTVTHNAGGVITVFSTVTATNSSLSSNIVPDGASNTPFSFPGTGLTGLDSSVAVDHSTVADNASAGLVLIGGPLLAAPPPGSDLAAPPTPVGSVLATTLSGNQQGGVLDLGAELSVQTSTLSGNAGAGVGVGPSITSQDAPFGSAGIANSTITRTAPFPGSGATGTGGGILLANASTTGGAAAGSFGPVTSHLSAMRSAVTHLVEGTDARTLRSAEAHGATQATPLQPGEVRVTGSIVADNDVPDCEGTITDGGYNLSSDDGNSCNFSAEQNDVIKIDPKLAALADNGGPTLTQLPAEDSPAVNVIPSGAAGCTSGATDQRGVARPQPADGLCDMGAVETKAAAPPSSSPASTSASSSPSMTTSAPASSSSLPSTSTVPESPNNASSTSLANTGARDVAALTGIGGGAVLLGVLALLGAAYLRRSRGRHSD